MQSSPTTSKLLTKRLIIGGIIAAVIIIAVFIVLFYQGVFTNPGERNTKLEQEKNTLYTEKLKETFNKESGFTLKDAKTNFAIYEKDGRQTMQVVIELTFEGKSLTFPEYKEFVYDVENYIVEKMNWKPSKMQIFYKRLPNGDERESVLQFESKVSKYLFGASKSEVINASATHYEVEIDEARANRIWWYYFVKNTVINVLTVTIIVLVILWIVRKIIKYKKSKSDNIDSK